MKLPLMLSTLLLTGCGDFQIPNKNKYVIYDFDGGYTIRLNKETGQTHRIVETKTIDGGLWNIFWDEIETPTLSQAMHERKMLEEHNTKYIERRDGKK